MWLSRVFINHTGALNNIFTVLLSLLLTLNKFRILLRAGSVHSTKNFALFFFTDLKFLLKLNAFKCVYATAFLAKYLGAIVLFLATKKKTWQAEEVTPPRKMVPTPPVPQLNMKNLPAPPWLSQNVLGPPFAIFLQFSMSPLVGRWVEVPVMRNMNYRHD